MKWFWKKGNAPKYKDKEKQKEYEAFLEEEKKNGEKNEGRAIRADYVNHYKNESVKKNYILYEAYGGRGMICSPFALFKQLLDDNRFSKYVHIWTIEDMEDNRHMIEHYARYKNVKFVEYNSSEYRKYLVSAKYLVNNVTFPRYFTKRKEQIYINTWHGIPLKTLGYDIPDGNISIGNIVRNFLSADYILSPNGFMTEIFKNAYKLDGIYEGTILEEGQLRNDRYFHTERTDIIRTLQQHGVNVDPDKKIIMYAPTWKGDRYGAPDVSMEGYFEIIQRIEQTVDMDEYQVLVKPHQIVYRYIKDTQDMTGQFIPAIIDANEILSVVDVLISDYSSIYFDYLVSEKPILFFIPDLEEYQAQRGLYFGLDKLPGPIAKNYQELELLIKDIDKAMKPHWDKYQEEKVWACGKDDGKVCERLVDTIFLQKESENAISCDTTSKKKILFYGGLLATNGITFSFLTLLKYLDYSKYDVTISASRTSDREILDRICQMPKEVRVLYRDATYNASYEEKVQHELIMEHGMDAGYILPEEMYKRELLRSFGKSHFDYVVEFSGYSRMFATLLSFCEEAKKVIWMHSDLKAELDKGEKGGSDVAPCLKVCISAYPYYDKVVGCSKTNMEINKRNFGTDKTAAKFTYARNLVNFSRIFEDAETESVFSIDEESYYIADRLQGTSTMKLLEVVKAPAKEHINFVSMGRLSPEKNYDGLIKAFARLYQSNSNVRLYVLGDGQLRQDLEKLIDAEGMRGIVHLLGALRKPFDFLRSCDCFILASHYEGQPLVIQEARVLNMPIIVTDFESVKDVLMENGQLVVRQDVSALQEGMQAFLDGKVPEYTFDYQAYNQEVYSEFEKVFAEW